MIVRLWDQGVPLPMIDAIRRIAADNVADLHNVPVKLDSPLVAIAAAQVQINLGDALGAVGRPIHVPDGNGGYAKLQARLIVALDDKEPAQPLVGFLTFKPHINEPRCATICHIAVDVPYRGKGVLRALLTELANHAEVTGLGCSVEKVPLYERFGYTVSGSHHAQVLMTNGAMSGQGWEKDEESLCADPHYQGARSAALMLLGRDGFNAAVDEQDRLAANEAERVSQYVRQRLSEAKAT